MIKTNRLLICAISTVLVLTSCSRERVKEEGNSNNINVSFVKNVQTICVSSDNQVEELILNGKVEYNPDKVINYVPLISGVVDRACFSLGDKVGKGQVLLDIRSAELNSLYSEVSSLEAELNIARRELISVQEMFDDNMMSERELLEAKAKVRHAEMEYERVKMDIIMYTKGSQEGNFSIHAPMDGYIVDKNISSGSTFSGESEALFTVADLSTVWITANVYASNLAFVKEGMEVEIHLLSYPNEIFTGKISNLSQVFDPEEKVLKARINMPNPDLKFKPEMSAVIRLKNEFHNKCVFVPSDALVFDDDRYFVIVENEPGNYEIREVSIKGHNGKVTYLASGLTEGEVIVARNQLLIYTGLKEG